MSKIPSKAKNDAEIFATLTDFTSKSNWDKFFTLRGASDSFEWYADWPALRVPILSQLSTHNNTDTIQILVPGCGNSRLSEYVYDAGYKQIVNIDFSKVAVGDMMRRYLRSRPEMKWRVMDMTNMQFEDEVFDIILDKGGLDALMEPEHGVKLGNKYLKEVKRVLKMGGKFLCLTLAESHVVGFLLSKFRFGWEVSIHAISQGLNANPALKTFMVVIYKEKLCAINLVMPSYEHSSTLDRNTKQIQALKQIVEEENRIRADCASGKDILYSLQDLYLGAKGNLQELQPGRRCQFILGEEDESLYTYKTVLLDAKQQLPQFSYHCGVFIVPKTRAQEWLFNSVEGQWLIVESSKAARLIMVFLDSRHTHSNMDDIQKDLSPLVKSLAPGNLDNTAAIPFMMANDGVKERAIIHQTTSATTGPIIVEDVIYETKNASLIPSEDKIYRRLTFERSLGLVQSEALLIMGEPDSSIDDIEKKKSGMISKSKKKRSSKRTDSCKSNNGSKGKHKVDHGSLASSYHSGIISGFSLIASTLENAASAQKMVETIVIGLGAGLLPMFLHGCFPFLDIKVVDLDPSVFRIAKDFFGFVEDMHLKVHIGDGIKYIEDAVAAKKQDSNSTTNNLSKIKIVIVDADSSDSSSGMTCPPINFVEECFLLSVKDFLSEGGLFVINLVCRSSAIREKVVSKMKEVFNSLFTLELEEEVNEVLFASSSMELSNETDHLSKAIDQLVSLQKIPLPDIKSEAQKLKRLK